MRSHTPRLSAGFVTTLIMSAAVAAPPDETNALRSLTPEEAEKLICMDATCRMVEEQVRVKYTLMVPYQETLDDGTTVTKCREELREKVHVVTRCRGGETLSLDGLSTLDTALATVLGRHKGPLNLNGVRDIQAEAATALSMHTGPLSLNGLETLSHAAADALLPHEGSLHLAGLKAVDLCTFETLRLKSALPRSITVQNANGRVIAWRQKRGAPFQQFQATVRDQSGLPVKIDKNAFTKFGLSSKRAIPAPPYRVMNEAEALEWLAREVSGEHPGAIVAVNDGGQIRFAEGEARESP